MAERTTRNAAYEFTPAPADGDWQEHRGDTYRCQVHLTAAAGGYAVVAAALPGVTAPGKTEQEALANIQQALATAITGYRTAGARVAWAERGEPQPGAFVRWVIVRL